MNCVAQTIFAMPVFNFQNDWRDIRFHPAATSDGDESNDPARPKPVLSSYFWIYLIVSVCLTAVTVFGWWRYTRTAIAKDDEEDEGDEKMTTKGKASSSPGPIHRNLT
jgi:hypothetical protein